MKKNSFFKVGALALTTFALCSCDINKSGQYAYMFKLTGNHYGEVLRSGFFEYCENNNLGYFEKTPAEANVGDQIQMIETLILQNVKAITVSAAGTTGYDNVLKQANDKGIKVVSVDSPISPKYRVTHIDHVKPDAAGEWLGQASLLMAHRIPYPVDYFKTYPTKTLGDYMTDEGLNKLNEAKTSEGASYKKKRFGYISSTQDSPSQNEWMEWCTKELNKTQYDSYVDRTKEFEIKYGNDEPIESKKCANAFIENKSVDVIIAPTSVAMAAAGQALKQKEEKNIKLTGLGMPSEMWDYMPKKLEEEGVAVSEFDAVCPYMALWDVKEFGAIAGAATEAAVKNEFDGKLDSKPSFTYKNKTYTVQESPDGGTKVVALPVLAFNKDTIHHYKEII